MTTVLILVAGGKGVRAGGDVPKQYRHAAGKALIAHAMENAASCPFIDFVQPVIGADHAALFADAESQVSALSRNKLWPPVTGGDTRQASTQAGLDALPEGVTKVMVHDAARSFLPHAVVERLFVTVEPGVGAIPVLSVPDSVKRIDGKRVIEDPDRTGLVRAQTPQAFMLNDLKRAFTQADAADFTDEASLARQAGLEIVTVDGDDALFKVTHASDFEKAEAFMAQTLSDIRTGLGFDVHAFEPGDTVTLCGVDVPHSKKLKGHSDADVGLHALTDAILGAIGAGDIGDHFPPSDPQWKGAPSDTFLRHAARLVTEKGGQISHVDVTLICERPKIGPHRATMKQSVATLLGLSHDRVSIKATTTEALGFTGREEGIAAQAAATVRLP
ncbi:MAG: bifunctional 2-C-methyl-D-erythritol 4-phosphate cytidylyltransferase/2-C-methyl-D-erythritol 2,4-cyclodiphosphate synthase [Pseudomonadota bacterium]